MFTVTCLSLIYDLLHWCLSIFLHIYFLLEQTTTKNKPQWATAVNKYLIWPVRESQAGILKSKLVLKLKFLLKHRRPWRTSCLRNGTMLLSTRSTATHHQARWRTLSFNTWTRRYSMSQPNTLLMRSRFCCSFHKKEKLKSADTNVIVKAAAAVYCCTMNLCRRNGHMFWLWIWVVGRVRSPASWHHTSRRWWASTSARPSWRKPELWQGTRT